MLLYFAIVAAPAAEPSLLMRIALKYEVWKLTFTQWAMFSDRELHINLGLLVFFLAMILLRKPMQSVWPVLAVILFEAVNEYLGMVLKGSWDWQDTKLDILFTLLWPVLFFLAARIGAIKSRAP